MSPKAVPPKPDRRPLPEQPPTGSADKTSKVDPSEHRPNENVVRGEPPPEPEGTAQPVSSPLPGDRFPQLSAAGVSKVNNMIEEMENTQNTQLLYDNFVRIARENKINISQDTLRLLDISSHAWIYEPAPLKENLASDKSLLVTRGIEIFEKALDDPHVSAYKKSDEPVPFIYMFYSLAQAGKTVIGDLVDKGFFSQ